MDGKAFLDGLDVLFAEKKIEDAGKWIRNHHERAKTEGDLPGLLIVLNEEIGYFRSVGRHEEACLAFLESRELLDVLDIREGASYATTFLNGATAFRAAGDHERAIGLYEEAQKAYEKSGIRDTYENAGLYNNLSILYAETGKRAEAAACLHKALDIIRKLPDCEMETATTYTNLGLLYLGMDEQDKAREVLWKARELFESRPDEEDAHYGAALGALAQAYYQSGNYEEAMALYEKAIGAVERSFGKNDAYRVLCDNYALVCEQAGQAERAGQFREQKPEIKGLALSRAYYETLGQDMLRERFPGYYERMTIGLAGYGSECFGYDDELSTDHDFGPAFCIWMDEEDMKAVGAEVLRAYEELPGEFLGFGARAVSAHGEGRVGVKCTQEFYREFLGIPRAPESLYEWLHIPESWLAAAVNGEIFKEGQGSFMEIRRILKNYYPEDVRIKKIAARAALMAQSGQYNYSRLMMRRDYVGAQLAVAEFLKAAGSMVYLLNRCYMPYYKWMHRGMEDFSILSDVPGYMEELSRLPAQEDAWEGVSQNEYRYGINVKDHRVVYIETICRRVREELNAQGLSNRTDSFLENHTAEIMSHIADEELRSLHVMEG